MKINHHISDPLLLEYASGSLCEGWSLAVATHLAFCPDCRTSLRMAEAAGAWLLENIQDHQDHVPDDHKSFDKALSWAEICVRTANMPQEKAPHQKIAQNARPQLPNPLRRYVGSDLPHIKWRALGLAAHHYPISLSDPSVSARLLRIPAGKPVPEHGHQGRELTLVLRGSFNDAGTDFFPGDLQETDASIEHQPIAGPDEDCICLAVTDAPLRFRSKIIRLIQPLIGI